jgi:molecular chaperone DnaK
MAIVGIDLGTTMSAIARLDEMGKPQVISNSEGDLITPSVVLFEDKNNKVVGKVAKQSAVAYPDRVVEFVKNEMGKATKWEFFGEPYSPEDISAIILRRMKEDAEQTLGEPIERAVITVPAIFGEAERNATKSAGLIAGLDVIALLDEPVAAALSYGFGRDLTPGPSPPDSSLGQRRGENVAQNVMVYDLGGGTFDLTVMRIAGNKITMLATDGDRRLGGRDWDDKIIEFVARQFETEHDVDPRSDLECFQDLRNRAEDAKKTLSRREQTRIICQYGGKTTRLELTRDKFNELTADLLSQTETTCQVVVSKLQESGKLPGGWADIHHVLLAGGSTRMLQTQEMLRRISGKEPEMLEVDLVGDEGHPRGGGDRQDSGFGEIGLARRHRRSARKKRGNACLFLCAWDCRFG